MKIKSIHNRVNIVFSAFVMIIMGIVIAKVIFIENKLINGYVKNITCKEDLRRKGKFIYTIKINSNHTFSNKLDIPCESVSMIKQGDQIQIDAQGQTFVQLTHNGIKLFNKRILEIDQSGKLLAFILIFLLATGDLIYRLYSRYRNLLTKAV